MVARRRWPVPVARKHCPTPAGDHKGPPFPTPPLSPLRTDGDVSNNPTRVNTTPAILLVSLAILLFCSLKDR